MFDLKKAKNDFLEYIDLLDSKYELSKTVEEDYFEPGMMENLDQYRGEYNELENIVTLRIEAKGLRYDNRSQNLEHINVGDNVQIIRDVENSYNNNNFAIKKHNLSFGNLPAELCNVLAPLYDAGYAEITESKVSYIERLRDRNRYAKQGIMFVEIIIRFKNID